MIFVNPPAEAFQNFAHETFYSELLKHEVGYNIYLPPGYEESDKRYPVTYHLHGYQGHESSDIGAMEEVCRNRDTITVFPNATGDNGYLNNALPMESIIITELIPFIDARYRTDATREGRSLSGFSMGGAGAFYYAVKYTDMFESVTAYAGTYHHFYHKGSRTVGVEADKAAEILESMLREERYLEENNILCWIHQHAERIRASLRIRLHIGTDDILLCDNEILHLYLDSLDIQHEYRKFEGVAHELGKIAR